MKIDKADKVFSLYIRTRDNWTCVRCGRAYEPPTTALQCSHFFGRRMESVRFDENNCDALCYGCHRFWEKEDREAYRDFKIKQLGQAGFDMLRLRAMTIQKKDRDLAHLYWKERLAKL
jgi:5-methylcytosine-specific restriction endonuclease McrA